jgi:alkanesulfonate monooxygenase SsuD/methylene tetrahydromethanopterin reductase-like flavin-dependent oxidoreductase (luciferase family)
VKKQSKKRAHLLGFIQHGVNSHATGMWRHPKDKVGWHFARLEYWQHMARTMERGLFDGMFIADELAPYNTHEDSSDAIVQWAVQCPTHEPSTIVPIITTATKHLGVGVTLSTAFEHPYSMCRGRPVLWQAGSSNQGRDFAAKHAEAIFAVHPNVDRMKQYADDLNTRMATKFNREPGSVKLICGLQTVVAETRSEAREKYERIRACIPPEGALAWISGHFGLDFSKYSPDEHVQNIEVPGIQGLFDSIIYAKGGAPVTVKEAATIYAQGMGMPVAVGTPADIADEMEHYMDDGGAEGFMLIATYTPGCFEEFVDLVVPELQRRGRFRTRYGGATLRENLLEA